MCNGKPVTKVYCDLPGSILLHNIIYPLSQGFQPEMPLPKITPRVETEPVRKMASISLTTPKAETGQNLGKIPQSAGYQYLLRMQKHFQVGHYMLHIPVGLLERIVLVRGS